MATHPSAPNSPITLHPRSPCITRHPAPASHVIPHRQGTPAPPEPLPGTPDRRLSPCPLAPHRHQTSLFHLTLHVVHPPHPHPPPPMLRPYLLHPHHPPPPPGPRGGPPFESKAQAPPFESKAEARLLEEKLHLFDAIFSLFLASTPRTRTSFPKGSFCSPWQHTTLTVHPFAWLPAAVGLFVLPIRAHPAPSWLAARTPEHNCRCVMPALSPFLCKQR